MSLEVFEGIFSLFEGIFVLVEGIFPCLKEFLPLLRAFLPLVRAFLPLLGAFLSRLRAFLPGLSGESKASSALWSQFFYPCHIPPLFIGCHSPLCQSVFLFASIHPSCQAV